MSEKFIERGNMTDVSLTGASVKTGVGGGLVWVWLESNQDMIMFLLGATYLLFQLIVIWPKVLSEAKRHWFNFIGLFDRRKSP